MRAQGEQTKFQLSLQARRLTLQRQLTHQYAKADDLLKIHARGEESKNDLHLAWATHGLWRTVPHLSAKNTISPAQVFLLAAFFGLMILGMVTNLKLLWSVISVLSGLAFFAVILFRAAVLAGFSEWSVPKITENDEQFFAASHKSYSVMAAIYKEAGQVVSLIAALENLVWPNEKKSVYLICEADDIETITAINGVELPNGFHLVVVPEGKPRTKPRALNFCLQRVNTDYLVIYDAEDRPHPHQLLEAAKAFHHSHEAIACFQSPLVIDNSQSNWLTRMFAIEYMTLFQGILPSLFRWKAPMPLGGTSNHFKTDLLKKVGAWDPYNVTEDADLGIRLSRFGFYCGTLRLPTYEEAPVGWTSWLKQRTRWMKGWIQTLLVHFRNPLRTARDMGWRNFMMLQFVLTALVVSMLVHPIFLITLGLSASGLLANSTPDIFESWTAGYAAFILMAGYTTYGLLAYMILDQSNRSFSKLWLLTLPLYWLLISVAGWRALIQLLHKPHEWEKTTHGQGTRKTPDLNLGSKAPLNH